MIGHQDRHGGSLSYATDLFDHGTAEELVRRYLRVLGAVTVDPRLLVGDIPLLTADESHALLRTGVGTPLTWPTVTVAEALGAAMTAVPDVVGDHRPSGRSDHSELSARSNALARELIAAGVGPESAVAICFERGPAMVVAIHAVLASGGSLCRSLQTVRPIVSGTCWAPQLRTWCWRRPTMSTVAGLVGEVAVLGVDVDITVDSSPGSVVVGRWSGEPIADGERLGRLLPEHPAYTMFTSVRRAPEGCDGAASGVFGDDGIGPRFYGFTGRDVFAQVLDYTFDPSILSSCGRRLWGAVGVVGPVSIVIRAMAARFAAHGVSVAVIVPSMLAVMVEVLGEDTGWASSLRVLCTGGEALAPAVAESVMRRGRRRWFTTSTGRRRRRSIPRAGGG